KHFQVPQGISADLIATLENFSREEIDQFALRSQRRAAVAQREGYFKRGLFAVRDPETAAVALESDEYPRPDTTLEGLAPLEPSFVTWGAKAVGPHGEPLDQMALKKYPHAGEIRHAHTAANSSRTVDGPAH